MYCLEMCQVGVSKRLLTSTMLFNLKSRQPTVLLNLLKLKNLKNFLSSKKQKRKAYENGIRNTKTIFQLINLACLIVKYFSFFGKDTSNQKW
jgi:hypothetical protein